MLVPAGRSTRPIQFEEFSPHPFSLIGPPGSSERSGSALEPQYYIVNKHTIRLMWPAFCAACGLSYRSSVEKGAHT